MNKLFYTFLLGLMLLIVPVAEAQPYPQNVDPDTINALPWDVQRQIMDVMKNDSSLHNPAPPSTGPLSATTPNTKKRSQSETAPFVTEPDDKEQEETADFTDTDKEKKDKEKKDKEKKDKETDTDAVSTETAPSKIEEYYHNGYNSQLGENLKQFGYDIFTSASIPSSRLAVPNGDYILGPGDALRIRVWGSDIDANFEGAISKDGTIDVPKIGIVPVTGVKFKAVESVIRKEANKYMQGINISVSLQKLRSVEIYVVGSVNNPGLHMVPAFSTVLGGLLAGGGVQKTGSLRQIELYRNGKRFLLFDLYSLLLKGARKSDIVLQDRDVIFVPRIGKTAAVAGAVTQEGIFELKDENTLGEMIDLSGGILPQGFIGRIDLRRYEKNRSFSIKNISTLSDNTQWRQKKIKNGDFIELRTVLTDNPNVVHLQGHVVRPDIVQYKSGMKLSDILTSPELLKPEAVMDYALLHRYDPASTRFRVERFSLNKIFKGEYDAVLHPRDTIQILSREESGIKEEISIEGAVWKPGSYDYKPGMRIKELLSLCGGVQAASAMLDQVYLYRYNKDLLNYEIKKINLDKYRTGKADFHLMAHDKIKIFSREEFERNLKVIVEGAVLKPGIISYNPGLQLQNIVDFAGGPQFGANTGRIQVSRKEIFEDHARTKIINLDLERDGTFAIEPFDYVFIPQVKDATAFKTVKISGEVKFPGSYRIEDGEKLSSLLERAGGFTENAYFYGAAYSSKKAMEIQQKSIDAMVNQLELESYRVVNEQKSEALSNNDLQAVAMSQKTIDSMLNKMRTVKAKGRVTIQLADIDTIRNTVYDFELENGDSIEIPKRPNFVAVVGSVYSPSAYHYQTNRPLAYYLKKSGGPVKSADYKHIYLIKANGEVISKNQTKGMFATDFEDIPLMPGDTIVVPENLDRISPLRMITNLTDVIFKIASTAGIAIAVL